MTDRKRNMYSFEEEDPKVIERLDAQATLEGTSRSALIRRVIRQFVFNLPPVPNFENFPKGSEQELHDAS